MKKRVTVLGSGLVGSVIANDLSTFCDVTCIDISEKNLSRTNDSITKKQFDIRNKSNVREAIKDCDIVVGAVPGYMGFKTLKDVIDIGKNIVDISFFSEDPFELNDLAKKNNVIAITDCGVAPGMGNIILGYHDKLMQIDSYECYVGGLPVLRKWPYEYKAVFSPVDVIEEYTRPARFIQNSKIITKEALSETELMNFKDVGTLESWNSDGLRTLIKTMAHVPNMIEKTLRYPGCVEYIKVLRETGFFSKEEIEVNGIKIKPVDVTEKLLFPIWKMNEEDRDFTVMKIIIKGSEKNNITRHEYNLFDQFQNDTLSMARTTGFTCSAAVKLILEKEYKKVGISPPEFLGDHMRFFMNYLSARNVKYNYEKK